jgi:hypothetical protein
VSYIGDFEGDHLPRISGVLPLLLVVLVYMRSFAFYLYSLQERVQKAMRTPLKTIA